MRTKLGNSNNIRKVFVGTFERYGSKSNWHGFPEQTILFKNVKDNTGRIVADHLWFNYTKGFSSLGEIKDGEIIEFYARVKEYWKGYKGYKEEVAWERPVEKDFKLSNPTKIRKIVQNDIIQSIL